MEYDPMEWYEVRYRVQGRDIEPTIRALVTKAKGDVEQLRIFSFE